MERSGEVKYRMVFFCFFFFFEITKDRALSLEEELNSKLHKCTIILIRDLIKERILSLEEVLNSNYANNFLSFKMQLVDLLDAFFLNRKMEQKHRCCHKNTQARNNVKGCLLGGG